MPLNSFFASALRRASRPAFRASSDHRSRPTLAIATALISIATLLGGPSVYAFPFYPSRLPNGELNKCANCHENPAGGGARNAFGEDFVANGRTWDGLQNLDSDGDGVQNADELQDTLRDWMEGLLTQPGDPTLVSSPGRADSLPGERRLVISEVNHPADTSATSWKVEITNTHSESVPLGSKWISASTVFDTDNPVPGQVRLADATSSPTMAAGEVAVIDLPVDQLSGWSATDGWVLLSLFEQQGDNPAPSVDQSLDHAIGDYVEWGTTTGKPFNDEAMFASIMPQWDNTAGVPNAVAIGESIEYDLAGNGVNDWYRTPTPFTLGLPRPISGFHATTGIALPRGDFNEQGLVPGIEGSAFDNFPDSRILMNGYPTRHVVVVESPVFGSARGLEADRGSSQPLALRYDNDSTTGNMLGLNFPWPLGAEGTSQNPPSAFSLEFEFAIQPGAAGSIPTEMAIGLHIQGDGFQIGRGVMEYKLVLEDGIAARFDSRWAEHIDSFDTTASGTTDLPVDLQISAVEQWVKVRIQIDNFGLVEEESSLLFVGPADTGLRTDLPVGLLWELTHPEFPTTPVPFPSHVMLMVENPSNNPADHTRSIYVRNIVVRSNAEEPAGSVIAIR